MGNTLTDENNWQHVPSSRQVQRNANQRIHYQLPAAVTSKLPDGIVNFALHLVSLFSGCAAENFLPPCWMCECLRGLSQHQCGPGRFAVETWTRAIRSWSRIISGGSGAGMCLYSPAMCGKCLRFTRPGSSLLHQRKILRQWNHTSHFHSGIKRDRSTLLLWKIVQWTMNKSIIFVRPWPTHARSYDRRTTNVCELFLRRGETFLDCILVILQNIIYFTLLLLANFSILKTFQHDMSCLFSCSFFNELFSKICSHTGWEWRSYIPFSGVVFSILVL